MNPFPISLLKEGLEALQLKVDYEPFMEYLKLLEKWNQAYNLTAIRDTREMISRHLFDSLALTPWVQGSNLLDVGTGPGLPGIPLALIYPNLQVTLLDSNGKKIAFLKEVKRQLQISNINIVQSRVEEYIPTYQFDLIISRAFSSISQFIMWTQHLIAPHGLWLAMKGQVPKEELKEINFAYEIKSYQVPYLAEERCCILLRP